MINLPVYKTSEKTQTIIKRGPHAKLLSISLSISSMTIRQLAIAKLLASTCVI